MRKKRIAVLSLLAVVFASAFVRGGERKHPLMGPNTMRAMVEIIENEPDIEKIKAATALGIVRVGGVDFPDSYDEKLRASIRSERKKALSALIKMLDAKYAPARAAAARSLGLSLDKGCEKLLLPLLKDSDWTVRVETALALAELGAKEYVEKLPFTDKHPQVRVAVMMAAARLGSQETGDAIKSIYVKEGDPAVRSQMLRTFVALKSGMDEAILKLALSDKDVVVRAESLSWIASVDGEGATGCEGLIRELLSDKFAGVRRNAAHALAAAAKGGAVKDVAPLLNDGDPTVRREAALALVRTASVEVLPLLEGNFGDEVREVRRAAAYALSLMFEKSAQLKKSVEAIGVRALSSDNSLVRREGIWLVGQIRSRKGFPKVLKFITDKPNSDNESAESALGLWAIVRTGYEGGGDKALSCFNCLAAELRMHACRALQVLKYKPAEQTLASALMQTKRVNNTSVWVYGGHERQVALRALLAIGGDKADAALSKIAASIEPGERTEMVEDICDYLVERKYKGCINIFRRTIDHRDTKGTYLAYVLDVAVSKLTGESVKTVKPEPKPYFSTFFINVKE